ncbi:OsmC family protein [Glycocaulis sp.]|uniref:OsmC family protein n=1 Tax=Glycocaulis sp. TaxID=1969725 RepID=UPI003F6EF04D
MSEHTATIVWTRDGQDFASNRYSRRHNWHFDGGAVVAGSSAPSSVPEPMSDPAAVDPEEAIVAALSSCHMLFFLALAAKAGFTVDHYEDKAIGTLGKRADGRMGMTGVELRPEIAFSGDKRPGADDIARLHHEAHERCFIANSVNFDVVVKGAGTGDAR